MSETFNQRIIRCRKLKDMTQAQVAEKLGMKSSTYSQMERCGNISAQKLLDLAAIFDVAPEYLLYGNNEDLPFTPFKPEGKEKPATGVGQAKTPIIYDTPEPIFVLSKKEENLIKIIRNLPKELKEEVTNFIEMKYKQSK